jgi:ribosome-associated toxin RatA of RatAB toxin-antitoxin module
MREVRRNALVPYTPLEMYALVNDVAAYPTFVPWCPEARVLESGNGALTATLKVGRAGLSVSLTTRNTLVAGESITMALIDGPLKTFRGRWDFLPIRAADGLLRGCRVELDVAFEFASVALGVVLSPLFEASWDSLVDAFVKRAHGVYGG